MKAVSSEGCICLSHMSLKLSHFRNVTITFQSKKEMKIKCLKMNTTLFYNNYFSEMILDEARSQQM